ncbi:hypothetical protein CO151_06990 [bacterium CG_4_9_14_3_um_filter_65_15]|nr:MAG: hypothetical protein CO151_06990 [bacterium CG_4_9_14_3_um_filter_65_15]
MRRFVGTLLALILGLAVVSPSTVTATPRSDMYTNVGIIGVTITNLGYVGNGYNSPFQPSCEYPLNSNVEHLFLGGLWVGAVVPDGTIHVSTGAQDASNLVAGDEIREFTDDPDEPVLVWSNSQNSDNFNPAALATQHIQVAFNDYARVESGNHVALGLKVVLRALAWGNPYADDFVILDYSVINISGGELRDLYVGFWNDTSVGSTERNNPYDPQATPGWNYYDDQNGGWGPPGWGLPDFAVPENDDKIWMMFEHDDDGDDGLATSWVGCRLLGSRPAVEPPEGVPPVSYNSWQFRHVPANDDSYYADDDVDRENLLPGKYQIMGDGSFTVGETQAIDYTIASDWVGLLSTGPFPYLAPEDTLHVTFAIACGADSLSLLANSKVAQVAYDDGFAIPAGPPSPVVDFSFENDTVILSWAPGDSLDSQGEALPPDSPLRSPEQHISSITGRADFQGYRIYRYQGETINEDPYSIATLVAQFDQVDGVGFDTGLPPLNEDGMRVFRDDGLLDGFPYWYSIVSFSAPDLEEGLPEFQSGFNENARLVHPGPAPADGGGSSTIGVYPNPYRAGSMFDNRSGEVELGRKIWFTGLPSHSRIQVFNLAGEVVKTLDHDDASSGQEPWDLLSDPVRAIASGLYIYVVENLDTGERQRGKLVIIK